MSRKIKRRQIGTRTVEIRSEDYEPFRVTFKTPGTAALVDIGTFLRAATTGEAKVGGRLIEFLADHIESWTLPDDEQPGTTMPADRDTLDVLPAEIIKAMFDKIFEAGEQAKN